TDPLKYFEAALRRALDYGKAVELSTGCEVADLVVHGVVPLNVTSEASSKISDFETELQDWLTRQPLGLHKATNHSWAPVVAWGNSPVKQSGQTELLLPLGDGDRRPSSFVRPEAAPFLMQDIATTNFARQFLDLASSGLEHIRQNASERAGIKAGLVQVYNYPVSLRENIVPSMALLRPESVAWTSLNSSLDGLEGDAPELGEHAQVWNCCPLNRKRHDARCTLAERLARTGGKWQFPRACQGKAQPVNRLSMARAALMAAMALEREIGTDHFEIERSPIVLAAQRVAKIARGEYGAAPEVVKLLENETKARKDLSTEAEELLVSPSDAGPVARPKLDNKKLKAEHQRFVKNKFSWAEVQTTGVAEDRSAGVSAPAAQASRAPERTRNGEAVAMSRKKRGKGAGGAPVRTAASASPAAAPGAGKGEGRTSDGDEECPGTCKGLRGKGAHAEHCAERKTASPLREAVDSGLLHEFCGELGGSK
ncbi:unnamed protein product, partial [Symbiodinium sp. KB8]